MSNALDILTDGMFGRDIEVDYRIKAETERNRKGFGIFDLRDSSGVEIEAAELEFKLENHEFKFGCNAFMYDCFEDKEHNQAYADAFKDIFNLAVIPFYWRDIEPEDGLLRFKADSIPIYRRPAPDKLLEYCLKNNITPKGHPLLWYAFFPDWVTSEPRKMALRVERRFSEIAERYGNAILDWDVINEVLTWSPYWNRMPPDQLELVFKLAEKYFPRAAKLNYNEQPVPSWRDDNGEYSPLVTLVSHMRSQGLKVDSTGLQFHIFEPDVETLIHKNMWGFFFNAQHILRVMDNFAKIAMPINISEITIPLFSGVDVTDGEELQARVAEKLYRLWFSHEMNTGIIWWNFVDGTAAYGKAGSQDGENRPRGGFLNYNMTPKKIHSAIRHLIKDEWTTCEKVKYECGRVNKFHGYYGDYVVTIKTDSGVFTRKITLSKGGFNKFPLIAGENTSK